MPPVLGLSTLNMGYSFEDGDFQVRTPTPVLARDFQGLSKAERLLGVGADDLNPPSPRSATVDLRPRGRRLHKMSSNLSLFTDIKNAIASVGSRSTSRAENRTETRSPAPFKPRPKPLKLEIDRRSITSNDDPDYEEPPKSASTLPSYYYKHSPSSPIIDTHPLPSHPPFPLNDGSTQYTRIEQDRIIGNLANNGMITKKMADEVRDGLSHNSSPGKKSFRKSSQSHQRGGSNVSKGSSTGYSTFEQSPREKKPGRMDSKGSTARSQPKISESSAEVQQLQPSGRRASAALPSNFDPTPDIQVKGVESPEGERVRTWLTHSALNQDNVEEDQQEWLAPERPRLSQDFRYSGSVRTLHSAETGIIFPIQGVPGDWASIRSHDRQSSLLVDLSQKPITGKTGKVYYTDLQYESVLALSESDSESDDGSVESALYRKRLSMLSNGNDTQTTADSSIPTSRSQSRKMSVNTRATSPRRTSLSSEKPQNYPIPDAQILPLSREASTKSNASQKQPPRENVVDLSSSEQSNIEALPELSANAESPPKITTADQIPSSSTTLGSPARSGPVPTRIRTDILARQNSVSSMNSSAISPKSHGPAGPAPMRPLPATPVRSAADSDKASVFSFPKPPRLPPTPLGLARSKSSDVISTSGESVAPSFQSSADSMDTVKPVQAASTPVIHEPAALPARSPVQSPVPQAPSRDHLSPTSVDSTSISFEEFSPIRLAFPDHVRKQMADQPNDHDKRSITPSITVKGQDEKGGRKPRSSIPTKIKSPQSSPIWKKITPSKMHSNLPRPALSPKFAAPQLPMPKSQSPLLSASPTSTTFSSAVGSDGRSSAPGSAISTGDDFEPEALPQIPVPPIPSSPKFARQFHRPTISDMSGLTTVSAPASATKMEHDMSFPEMTPEIGIARSDSDGANLVGKKRRNGGHESQIRQVRLSRIGNAV